MNYCYDCCYIITNKKKFIHHVVKKKKDIKQAARLRVLWGPEVKKKIASREIKNGWLLQKSNLDKMMMTQANKTLTREKSACGFDLRKWWAKTGIEFHWPGYQYMGPGTKLKKCWHQSIGQDCQTT